MPDIIVWQMPDGSLAITAPGRARSTDEKTDAEYLDNIAAKAKPPGAVRLGDVLETELPDDSDSQVWTADDAGQPIKRQADQQAFFDTWEWDGAAVVSKKKNTGILKTARKLRNRLLNESDSQVFKYTEIGDAAKVGEWKAYRQSLRDLPQNYGADPINAKWPVKPV